MKKLLLTLAVGGVGYVLWRKYAQEQDERDLWTEVTDDVE
jgi:hypothetical protein